MTEPRQYWIREVDTHNGGVYWKVYRAGVWLDNKEVVARFIHVIEYSAFAELQEKLKVAEEALEFYGAMCGGKTARAALKEDDLKST